MALSAYPQPITYFPVGHNGSVYYDPFLDALDASFCTYDGDDSGYAGNFETYYESYGYTTALCGSYSPPNVISTSWGGDEFLGDLAYENRQCHEYLKLGLAGVSVVYSSGDNGVAGVSGKCENGTTDTLYTTATQGRFILQFPSDCPWVTSVGSTTVPPGTNIVADAQNGVVQSETATTAFASGGGFSSIFSTPSYQSSALATWWSNNANVYDSTRFNNSQQSRGVPDVSANGWNFIIPLGGKWYLAFSDTIPHADDVCHGRKILPRRRNVRLRAHFRQHAHTHQSKSPICWEIFHWIRKSCVVPESSDAECKSLSSSFLRLLACLLATLCDGHRHIRSAS